jgi:hypothetical protein
MGQIAIWIMPQRVNNPAKTIFRLRFAKSPKVTDRKAMVRGINQLVSASPIAVRARKVIAPDNIFCKAPGSKTHIE